MFRYLVRFYFIFSLEIWFISFGYVCGMLATMMTFVITSQLTIIISSLV